MTTPIRPSLRSHAAVFATAGVFALALAITPATAQAPPRPAPRGPGDAAMIVAVVNGEVITQGDLDNRRRLFALTTGMGGRPRCWRGSADRSPAS